MAIDRVRQQCESYAAQIQEAGQGLAELLQRQRIVANEIEIFKQDVESKEASIQVRGASKRHTDTPANGRAKEETSQKETCSQKPTGGVGRQTRGG